MKWLLTNCAAPRMSPFYTGEKRPPLGLGFLISALGRAGHSVQFIDNYLQPADFLETDYLRRHRIDAIGISVNTICFRDFVRMAGRLKRMRADGTWRGLVVVGGPHAAALPESIPDWVDHVVVGEGEQAIVDIANGTASRVVRSARVASLDTLDPPAYDVFAPLPYDWTAWLLDVAPVFTMNTSRGCPFDCKFCCVPANWGRQYRCFSAGWILEQIKHLHDRYGCRGIYFREDNFSVNRKRVQEFSEGLLRAGLDIQWLCETRTDTLDRELLRLMYRAGCRGLYIGVESGSQRLLDLMSKRIHIPDMETVFACCHEIGIRTYASFIVGLPTETPAERQATVALRDRLGCTSASMGVFVGIPRSELYDYVLEKELHSYIDDRGLAYSREHDRLVDEFYCGDESRRIPWPAQEHYVRSLELLTQWRRVAALKSAVQAACAAPTRGKYWRQIARCLVRRPAGSAAERTPFTAYGRLSAVRGFVARRHDAQRVVVYGVGQNGRLLLAQLRGDTVLEARELCVADDRGSAQLLASLGLPRIDPRGWEVWPSGTIAVVTPNEYGAMRATLTRAGGCEGRDFIILADAAPASATAGVS